jgi:hypothetical protein
MGVKCFMVTETNRFRASLRRFVYSSQAKCPGPSTYHNADGPELGILEGIRDEDGFWNLTRLEAKHRPPKDDPRWPVKCDSCDYRFTDADEWQVFSDHIYVDETGKEHSLRDATPGMMWDAFWTDESDKGPDGKCLIVICPNGRQWMIDGPASNCTMKNDTGPYGVAHRCWTRIGTPPLIQVGKQFGKTCGAGAGSIQAGNYHGFLGKPGHAAPGDFT